MSSICDTGTSFRHRKSRQGGVDVDRDCILGLAASDTQESSLRSSWNFLTIDETYFHSYCCICMYFSTQINIWSHCKLIWWIINTHALQRPSSLMSSTELWQPSLHPHTWYAIERPYNNQLQWDNTLTLVCTIPRNHIFLHCTILRRYNIAMCQNTSMNFECHILCTKC